MTGWKLLRHPEEWTSAKVRPGSDVRSRRQNDGKRLTMIFTPLLGRRVLRAEVGIIRIGCSQDLGLGDSPAAAEVVEIGGGPVDIPSHILPGPLEDRVHGLPGDGLDREDFVTEVGPDGRRPGVEQPSVFGYNPGVIAVMVERVRLPPPPTTRISTLSPGRITGMEL